MNVEGTGREADPFFALSGIGIFGTNDDHPITCTQMSLNLDLRVA